MTTANRNSTDVTTGLYRPDAVDETKYAAFVAKTVRSNMKARDKANAKGDARGLWFGFTDEQCRLAAEQYCHCYRHHFRVLVPAKATDPRQLVAM